MRGNLKSASIKLLGLLLLFLITASGVFAFSAAKSHQAKPALSLETALKAIDFAAENDISIDSELSANLRQSINFNRNRYYSPALGRFVSKDPIGFNGGMNLYRYADNNPVLFSDPWVLKKVIDWLNPIPIEPQDYIYDPTWHLEYDAVRYIKGIVAQETPLDYIWIKGEYKAKVTTQQWESRFAKDIVVLENWAYVLKDDEDDCFVPQKGIGPHLAYYFNTLVEDVSFDRIGTRIGKTDAFKYSKMNGQTLYPQRMENRRDNPRSPYWVKTKLAELEKIISEFETALLR